MTEPRAWCIRLPWTKPPLSDNSRLHWTAQHRIKRDVRTEVARLVRNAGIPPLGRCEVNVTYVPRDNRRRDTDNLSAFRKVAADAVVDAEVVPDDTPQFMGKPEPVILPGNRLDPRLLLTITEVRRA